MADTLEILIGSKERSRLLRFFLQNPEKEFNFKEVVRRTMLNKNNARTEINKLLGIKFIMKRVHKGVDSYILNQGFNY